MVLNNDSRHHYWCVYDWSSACSITFRCVLVICVVLLVSINIKMLYYLLEILMFSPPKTYFPWGFDCSEYFFCLSSWFPTICGWTVIEGLLWYNDIKLFTFSPGLSLLRLVETVITLTQTTISLHNKTHEGVLLWRLIPEVPLCLLHVIRVWRAAQLVLPRLAGTDGCM